MAEYRKKPVVIEAFKFELGPMKEEWPDWFHAASRAGNIEIGVDKCYIKTLEGEMEARVGDYVIRGIAGEIYPCKPDIFQATHEAVEDDDPGDDPAYAVLMRINDLLLELAGGKPNDRSPLDRSWAIAQTEAEKLLAWWLYGCLGEDDIAKATRHALRNGEF